MCQLNRYLIICLKADILVHVESFEKSNMICNYSMSTKIPEYLSIGRPIICFGQWKLQHEIYL